MKASRGKGFRSPVGWRQAGPTTLAGIVPDGVARVEIQSSTGSVSAAVASNFFLLKIPPARNGVTPSLGKLSWYDTSGKLLAAFASSVP